MIDQMTEEEKQAYEWAKAQRFESIAARYARTLARFIERPKCPTARETALLEACESALAVLEFEVDSESEVLDTLRNAMSLSPLAPGEAGKAEGESDA